MVVPQIGVRQHIVAKRLRAPRAFVDEAKYQAMYEASIRDPNAFWGGSKYLILVEQ